jgi:hypothetical protein
VKVKTALIADGVGCVAWAVKVPFPSLLPFAEAVQVPSAATAPVIVEVSVPLTLVQDACAPVQIRTVIT